MNYDRAFFCQAYNDISYILSSIESEDFKFNLIIVVNNYNLFQFLENLNIQKTHCIFISKKLYTLKNPFQIINEIVNIRRIKKQILSNLNGLKITVYATIIDLLTCSCIEVLRKNNDIYIGIPILESDNFIPSDKTSLKVNFLSKIYKTKLQSFQSIFNKVIGLPLNYVDKYLKEDYIFDKLRILSIRKKYAKNYPVSKNPFILLLDTKINTEFRFYKNNHSLKMSKIFNFLSRYETHLKGHPRLGPSILAMDYDFKIIDKGIPVDYIDLSNCVCVVGMISQALVDIADLDIKSISLLKYVDFEDVNLKNKYIKSLTVKGNSRIDFPESIDDFELLINKYSVKEIN